MMLKSALKRFARACALVIVAPVYFSYGLSCLLGSADQALESHSQLMSLLPGRAGNYLRNAFYRLTLEHCDPSATICFGVLISKRSCRLEKNVYVGPRCMLGWVTLEQDVLLGPAVQIPSGPHTHGTASRSDPIRTQSGTLKKVTVKSDSWIGAATVVLADVGPRSIVGANSTVTRPLPGGTVAVGSPAKLAGLPDEVAMDWPISENRAFETPQLVGNENEL